MPGQFSVEINKLPDMIENPRDYRASYKPRLLEKILAGLVDSLQKR
jgi:hypothetical protein